MDNRKKTVTTLYCNREIAQKIALIHCGTTPQTPHTDITHHPQTSHPTRDPNAMDIDTLNLSPVKRSHCLRNHLHFIFKQLNCSTRNHPREETPAHPACHLEQVRTTMTAPANTPTATATESEFGKYVKELEGKGKKSTKLLRLLQLAVEANKNNEASF